MADTPRELTDEEKKLAALVALADSKSKIAKAELDAATYKKSLAELTQPSGEKEAAALRAAISASNKSAVADGRELWKPPAIEALEGKVTSSGTAIENRVLANETLHEAYTKLVQSINNIDPFKGKDVTFIILNSPDIIAIQTYNGVLEQLRIIEKIYEDALLATEDHFGRALTGGTIDPLLPVFAAGGIIRSVVDLLSLFRTNTELNHFDLVIDDMLLVASFVKSVGEQKLKWTVYHPSVYPVDIIPDPAVLGTLRSMLAGLRTKSNKMAALNWELDEQLVAKQVALAAATNSTDKLKLEQDIRKVQELKAKFLLIMPLFTQVEAALTTAGAAGTASVVSQLLMAERLSDKLGVGDCYLIKLVAVSRGSTRIRSNLFRSSRIRYSGGSELNCLIFHPSGKILFADTIVNYKPFTKSSDIKQ